MNKVTKDFLLAKAAIFCLLLAAFSNFSYAQSAQDRFRELLNESNVQVINRETELDDALRNADLVDRAREQMLAQVNELIRRLRQMHTTAVISDLRTRSEEIDAIAYGVSNEAANLIKMAYGLMQYQWLCYTDPNEAKNKAIEFLEGMGNGLAVLAEHPQILPNMLSYWIYADPEYVSGALVFEVVFEVATGFAGAGIKHLGTGKKATAVLDELAQAGRLSDDLIDAMDHAYGNVLDRLKNKLDNFDDIASKLSPEEKAAALRLLNTMIGDLEEALEKLRHYRTLDEALRLQNRTRDLAAEAADLANSLATKRDNKLLDELQAKIDELKVADCPDPGASTGGSGGMPY